MARERVDPGYFVRDGNPVGSGIRPPVGKVDFANNLSAIIKASREEKRF